MEAEEYNTRVWFIHTDKDGHGQIPETYTAKLNHNQQHSFAKSCCQHFQVLRQEHPTSVEFHLATLRHMSTGGTQSKVLLLVVCGEEQAKAKLHAAHDERHHPGAEKTRRWLTKTYWWPYMAKQVVDYVHTCTWCQEHHVVPIKAPLVPIIPSGPREHVQIDGLSI